MKHEPVKFAYCGVKFAVRAVFVGRDAAFFLGLK